MSDPEPNRKTDPDEWQAWFNRQVAAHDEEVEDTQGQGITIADDDE